MSDQSSDTLRHGAMILASRRCSLNKKPLRDSLQYGYYQTSDFPIFNQGNLGCKITNVKMLVSQNVLRFQLLQRKFRELSFRVSKKNPAAKAYSV